MPEYSQSAYRHGSYVAKYGVFPTGKEQLALANTDYTDNDPINIISQSLRTFHLTVRANRDPRIRAAGFLAARVPHVVGRSHYGE
jgi:hypothetical protein